MIVIKNIRETGRPVKEYGQKVLVGKIKQRFREKGVYAEFEVK